MTERDEFAKVALQSMMSRAWFVVPQWKSVEEMTAQYAKEAYAFADAMMSARSEEKSTGVTEDK
jgi:predicted nucleic-acid-binding protein